MGDKSVKSSSSIHGIGHVLAIPYPTQGHINPMLQFCKRLAFKGVKATIAITRFIYNNYSVNLNAKSSNIQIDTISDGYDDGGFAKANSIADYLSRMEEAGSKSLVDLIIKHKDLGNPIDCILYDPFLRWALDVAKKFDLLGVTFFTQMCGVNCMYYRVHKRLLTLPVSSPPVSIAGLPLLELHETPSFVSQPESYPAYFHLVMNQFSNIHKADLVLVNTFYDLEAKVVDSMSKECTLLTIGPTIPSSYLDKRVEGDNSYDLNLFELDSSLCMEWLKDKPSGSVVYVSFGSLSGVRSDQMEEIAMGLKATNFPFIWVIRKSEKEKLKKELAKEILMEDMGLLVGWSPQLQVLSNDAVGCFFTHCGWNSTLEGLSLGVPMVGMPQWTDQPVNAKFVEDVWEVGVRVKVEPQSGIVKREEVEGCLRQVMEGERGSEMKRNAKKWKELAIEAVSEGGTSDKNVDEFVSKLKKGKMNVD